LVSAALAANLGQAGAKVYRAYHAPTNDGGLALGQAYIIAMME